jgi:hypothetical protein
MTTTDQGAVPVETKVCDFCLNPFRKTPDVSRYRWLGRRFCGDACARAYNIKRRDQSYEPAEKTCLGCGQTFRPRESDGRKEAPTAWRDRLTCSLACAGRLNTGPKLELNPTRKRETVSTAQRKRWPSRTCQACGKAFYNPKRKGVGKGSQKRRYSEARWATRLFCGKVCAGRVNGPKALQPKRQAPVPAQPVFVPIPETLNPIYDPAREMAAIRQQRLMAEAQAKAKADEEQAEWLIQLMEPHK